MKLLIQNYSNQFSSEPLYLNESFNSLSIKSAIWDASMSSFDAVDANSPDVIICKANDSISSLCDRIKSTNIELLLNVTGLNQEQVINLVNFIKSKDVKMRHLIKSPFEHLFYSNMTFIDLLPAVDLFMPKMINLSDKQIEEIRYTMPLAIITDGSDDSVNLPVDPPHHNILFSERDNKPYDPYDMKMDIFSFCPFYSFYENIFINGSEEFNISQVFFDAIYRGKKVTSNIPIDKIEKIFSETSGDENIEPEIKRQISENHTCINRAKQILSTIGA